MAQFAHVQTHSRKISANHKGKNAAWTASDIASEARRDAEHSKHVEDPKAPIPLVGDLTTLEEQLDQYLKENKITTKNGTEREARSDAHVMISNVYSWPEHVDYFDKKRFDAFAKDVIEFHRKEFGECHAAVTHLDEEFPHIHAYTYDKAAKDLHPGEIAKKQAYADGKTSKEANQAYREAMSDFQERFYQEVGKRHGLDRVGPKRQRLTRKQWREQKEARLANADRLRAAEEQAKELEAKNSDLGASVAESEELVRKNQEAAENAAEEARKASERAAEQDEKAGETAAKIRKGNELLKKHSKTLKSTQEDIEKTRDELQQERLKVIRAKSVFSKIRMFFKLKTPAERRLEKELKNKDQELKDLAKNMEKMDEERKDINKQLRWAKGDLHKLQNSSADERKKQQKIIDDLVQKKDELHNKWRLAESKVERMTQNKKPQAQQSRGPSNSR